MTAAICVAAGAAGAAASAAGAENIVLQPGHALRIGTTQEIVGRDGDDLFVGILGYNGHIVPTSLWLRQSATSLAVGRNPSGPLGSPSGTAEVLFSTASAAPAFGALPQFTVDGVTEVGQDRIDLIFDSKRTIHVFVNGTASAPYARSQVSGENGLIVAGTPIGVMSPTDVRVGNASNANVAYQAQQISIPPAAAVDRAERDVSSAAGWCEDFPDPYDYLNLLLDGHSLQEGRNVRNSYFNTRKANALLKKAEKALAADDYKGARGAAPALVKLNRKLKAADKAVVKIFKATARRKKFLKKTRRVEAAVDAAVKQLELM